MMTICVCVCVCVCVYAYIAYLRVTPRLKGILALYQIEKTEKSKLF